jgi:hypothetical protein
MSHEPRPKTAFAVVERTPRASSALLAANIAANASAETVPDGSGFRPGIEDNSGRGAIGMTLGIVGGYALGYLVLVPLLPKDKSTNGVMLLTFVTMASMVGLGVLGYFATRKRKA